LMFVIAHNKIFYRRCALFLPSFPVHTIKFILSSSFPKLAIHDTGLSRFMKFAKSITYLLALSG
jgi:hypothetical protein